MSKEIKDIFKVIESYKIRINNFNKYVNKESIDEQKLEDITSSIKYFFIISVLSPQSKSTLQQTFIEKKFEFEKISPKLEKGDSKDKDNLYYEIKCSTPSANGNILNIVQIRLHHELDYYLCVFIDDLFYKNNFLFLLTKEEMEEEIKILGHSAHGVINKNNNNNKQEYRISIDLNDLNNTNTSRWLEKYRDSKLEEKLFNS
ncbi:hypothetical protein [Mycoplasma sp. Z386]